MLKIGRMFGGGDAFDMRQYQNLGCAPMYRRMWKEYWEGSGGEFGQVDILERPLDNSTAKSGGCLR